MNPVIEEGISTFVHRIVGPHYRKITVVSFLLTALAAWVIATQWNINSDFRALLPQTSEAAEAMEEVGERVGSGSSLFVVIDSPDLDANKEFARDLSERLREIDEVSLAHFHNDKTFFEEHQLLYLKQEDLAEIRSRIKEKIKEEKQEANPLFASLDEEEEDEDGQFIETDDIRQKYDHLSYRNKREYFVSEDQFSLTLVVRFSQSSTDLAATNRLIGKVKEAGRDLDPEAYHGDMELEYGGGLIRRKEDYGSIVADIKSSALFTFLGLLLVIGIYFRRVRATALVMVPLVMGVAWTLAVAFLYFGELTTVSIFIFAILLGLGIDFSIHLLSGYDHARVEGRDPIEALVRTYRGVGSATTIGAMTTFATFVVISFAQFRGLSQFGQVASVGVFFTLSAMIVVLPSLILTFHDIASHEPDLVGEHGEGLAPLTTTTVVGRYAPLAISLAVSFTAIAVTQYSNVSFEEDFRELGEVEWPWERVWWESMEKRRARAADKGREAGDHVQEHAGDVRQAIDPDSFEPVRQQSTTSEKYRSALKGTQSSTPTVLLFDDKEAARTVTRYMRRKKKRGDFETALSIASIYAFMPGTRGEQKERMEEIREIRQLLEEEDLSFLDGQERKEYEEFRQKLDVEPVTIYDLPSWTKHLFKEPGQGAKPAAEEKDEDFAFEYVVYVNEAIDQMEGEQARRFLEDIKEVRQTTGVDFDIGSQSFIYVQMLDEIKDDGLRMITIALVIVFLLLAVAFRSPLRGLVAMTPFILGASWMFGLLPWLGVRLDFFNVVIIPVVIGIGVDAGVHFYRRYLERGEGSIGVVLRTVGAAVSMAVVTSIVGFGGLAITEHGGLSSIGHLAIVGLSTTWLATMLVMPVILWIGETYQVDLLLPRESDLASDV